MVFKSKESFIATRPIEQARHGYDEMVGYHCGYHDVGKGEVERRQKVGIPSLYADDLPEYAI